MIDLALSVWEQQHAQGVAGMVKTVSDVERYRHLLMHVRPDWIVECGTFNGASACWFADTAGANVVTVDTHPQADEETRQHPRVTWITGNSADPHVAAYVRSLVGGVVMVVLDSDHSARHVYEEMLLYGPLVTCGSYMVVEDGIVRHIPTELAYYDYSSPLDAIERFLEPYGDDWFADQTIEDLFPTTQNPKGFLLRVC